MIGIKIVISIDLVIKIDYNPDFDSTKWQKKAKTRTN